MLCEAPQGVTFHFSVQVNEEMNSEDLLLEFIRQYSGLDSRDRAITARDTAGWQWLGVPQTATSADVQRGYVLVRVTDRTLSPVSDNERRAIRRTVAGMAPQERDELHAETDRRFWNQTNYRRNERLGTSADDRRMSEYWLHVRDRLVQTRQSILELPEHVRELLFDPSASRRLSPTDYEIALRVGQKLASMSAVELTQWQSRITASTDDWLRFEASLDAYLESEAGHRRERLELGRLSARLYGLEALYELRKQYRRLTRVPSVDEFGVRDTAFIEARADLRNELEEALHQNGFSSLSDFDTAIENWRQGFERETVRVADRMLDQLDHVFYVAQERYGNAGHASELALAVSASGASEHFARSDREASRSIGLMRPRSAMNESPIDEAGAFAAASASAEASSAGRSAVQDLSATHPVLSMPDFPHRDLANAAPQHVQSLMLDYIRNHRNAIRETRTEIHSTPSFIYRLDALIAASREAQGIEANSILDLIIRDHISDRQITALLEGVAVAALALALTVATLGGGALAVGAGAAAFGIGTWQAIDAFKTYVREQNAHDAQLLSEDPSIAWLVLACVGAAADLGAAVAAVRTIRPAALALNESGDVLRFRDAVEALPDLDRRIQRAVVRGAEAQAEIRRQVQAIVAIGHRANEALGVGIEGGYRLMIIAWHGARRGLARFEQFLAELQQARIVSRISELSPTELRFLRDQFDEGLRRAIDGFVPRSAMSAELRAAAPAEVIDEAAAFGRSLGLEDDTALSVLESQARLAREVDATAVSPENLRRAMRQRANDAPDLHTGEALFAEHIADETRRGVRAAPEELTASPSAGRGGYREAQLSGDIGEASEAAGAGARALPPTYAQHITRDTREDLRAIFGTHGEDALRVFTDRLQLPANGLRQVEVPTAEGMRIVDRLFEDGGNIVLREIKRYPNQVLTRTSRIGEELGKDLAILERYPYAIVDWHLIGRVQGRFLDELIDLTARFPGRFRIVLADTNILRSFPRGSLSRGSEASTLLARDLATLTNQSETVVTWSIANRRIATNFLADLRAAEARFPGRFVLHARNITEVPTP